MPFVAFRYSIGGYNPEVRAGVATVELYDPRMPSWVAVEPMKYSKACHSSAVLGGSIFTFGGLEDPEQNILDVVGSYTKIYACISKSIKHQIANVQIVYSYRTY